MSIRKLKIVLTAIGLAVALSASGAIAQDHGGGEHGGGHDGGGGHAGAQHEGGGAHGRAEGFQGGRGGDHDGFGHDHGGGGGGFLLGAILGYYGGHPYYCRNHRHWRWSNHQQRYVYYTRGGAC